MSAQEVKFSPEVPGRVVLPPPDKMAAHLLPEAGERRENLAKIIIANPRIFVVTLISIYKQSSSSNSRMVYQTIFGAPLRCWLSC